MYNQQIVKRVSDGDLKAFRKMYVDCAPAVYDCAYDILHDVVRSNMVVARTFVDVFNYLPQLKKLRLFDEWVYRLSVYHADNIALEDFIRGSEKLETIWRDIIRELGVNDPMRKRPMIGRDEEPERPRPPMDAEHDKRMRAIEKEAEAIHQDRTLFAGFAPPTAEHAKSVTPAFSNRPEPLAQREIVSPVSSFKPAAPPMPEEEWTPILFPSEGEEVRYDRAESPQGALHGVRKTVLMPTSKAFSLKRAAAGDSEQENFYGEAIRSPQSIPQEVAQVVQPADHEPVEWADSNPYAFWDSPIQAEENGEDSEENLFPNQEEETADSEFSGRYEEELSSIPRLSNFQDEQLERFRALLDETRTSEKASDPPPPEPRDDLDLAALVRNIKDKQDDEEEHEEKKSEEPKRRPKKRKKRRGVFHTILVVLLTLVIVVILPLILMAYHIFATPSFLRGAVLMTTYVLQNIFSFGAQAMSYFKSLS